ncbi:MAG: AI-2E family transporter [Pseudomonadales bacterium]
MEVISHWVNRYFSNEEAIYLVVMLVVAFVVLVALGGVLMPVLTALVLAFLLTGLVERFKRLKIPEKPAVYLTFVLFLSGMVAVLIFIVPLVVRQTQAFVAALPDILVRLREIMQRLVEAFPELITEAQVAASIDSAAGQLGNLSTSALELLVGQVPSLVGLLIYVVLVPISVFFFLKDRQHLLDWVRSLMPAERLLIEQVGAEMNTQLANYVRGKFIEILIVGAVTFITLTAFGLNYAALLSVLVGLSVLIPFVGAAVVTIPVALVALIQFGWSWEMAYVMAAYGIIQALDGNVLVPLLFSEAVDLHPITIIVAVLAFGGLWGVWGVFFAIPLATLVKAIYNAWPREADHAALAEVDVGQKASDGQL